MVAVKANSHCFESKSFSDFDCVNLVPTESVEHARDDGTLERGATFVSKEAGSVDARSTR
jgi:hypothetical protein